MPDCLTCQLVERRDAGEAPLWDAIVRTPHWDVVHAFGTAVEGWLVLVVRRHLTSVADLSDQEAAELGPLIRDVSSAVQRAVDCDKTYVVQFAEHPQHPHVHVHVIPRRRDLPDERQGPRVFSLLGVPDDEAVPADRMDEIAALVRADLHGGPS
ncbi:MAG: HIT family protein [Acidimicrobiales bacterium]